MGRAGFILPRPFIPGLKSQGFQGISYNLERRILGFKLTQSLKLRKYVT